MVSSSIDVFGLEESAHDPFPSVIDIIKVSRLARQLSTNILTKEYVLQSQAKVYCTNKQHHIHILNHGRIYWRFLGSIPKMNEFLL